MPPVAVKQLRFVREKWLSGLEGLSAEDAQYRPGKMNSISWMVGHLAYFEQRTWLEMAQQQTLSEAVKACGFGEPASNPPYADMMRDWQAITAASDVYLDSLSDDDLMTHLMRGEQPARENIGTNLLRHIWHYWYHLGEMQAIRQMLGHENLPGFVGYMPQEMTYGWEA